ncbi:MAG: hypothetical protein RIT45_249 [Pseudomonadota bacterium]|jgi:MYXO-CTERM domain-containing protein
MHTPLRKLITVAALVGIGLTAGPASATGAWPPAADADMSDPANWPNDPSFASCKKDKDGKCELMDGKPVISGGDWNLWSFTPPNYAAFPGFRQVEVPMGVGMHADRAWTKTVGDRRVIIAVLDSGIKWDESDLVNKHFLNRGELPAPEEACRTEGFKAEDPHDANGDGIFNMLDYAKENGTAIPKTPCDSRVSDKNGNGLLDPQDLIQVFSDGKDDDGNGFKDDISGWDFFEDDNDAYDDTRFGHGSGEARDSAAEGNNGRGSIGVCPECTVLNVRVADSFVCDANDFAAGSLFAVDSGASVLQSALGSINMTPYARDAIEYLYDNNVVFIASAADELSYHHNMPSTNNHTVYVHAIVFDGASKETSTTFLNFNNCTNYGGQLVLSTPGTGCSSEAVGMTSGHAGMIYSMALKTQLDPPLSAEEVRSILIQSADDIDVPESKTDETKFPSGPGWDLHFGYGRNNVYESMVMIEKGHIPPDADILEPWWFEPIEVTHTPKVDITGRIGKRVDGKAARYDNYDWTLEMAKGVDPKSGWEKIADGKTAGLEGKLTEWDVAAAAAKYFDFTAPLTHHDQYTVTIKLTVKAKAKDGAEVLSEMRKTVGLYKDPDLLPGFPKRVDVSFEASPKVFDIDGDGQHEIIQPGTDGTLHAWKADGTEAAGWPVKTPVRREFDKDHPFNITGACAFRDDKTGCIAKNGKMQKEYHEAMIINAPAIGDLDGDGKIEVVVSTYDGHLLVFGADGKMRPGFPVKSAGHDVDKTTPDVILDDGFCGSPALADLDKDGKLEIIQNGMDQYLYVWRHDGTMQKGFPLLVSDPALEGKLRARIVSTPAIGDVDGDGQLDIVVGTNEVLGAESVKNEGRGYVIHGDGSEHAGGPFHAGWPVKVYGLMAEVLPLVGRGVPGNPALADLDFDGKLEVQLDSIGSAGRFYRHDGSVYEWPIPGSKKKLKTFNNQDFGAKSDTADAPAYILIASASLGRIDPTGGIDVVKATAGFNFALTFASGGKRANFDHHLSAWDTQTATMLEGWPRRIEDWQFFSNPAIVDIDGDKQADVVAGSAGYLVHAWNHLGAEPKGWPKYTNGWVMASPGVGDIDGDGKYDVAVGTRNGWMFAWKSTGDVAGSIREWGFYGHDVHNTNNYHNPIDPYHTTGGGGGGEDAGPTDTTGGDTSVGADTVAGDVEADTGGGTTTPPSKKDDGCTAAPVGGDASGTAAVLLLLAALLLWRRREVIG